MQIKLNNYYAQYLLVIKIHVLVFKSTYHMYKLKTATIIIYNYKSKNYQIVILRAFELSDVQLDVVSLSAVLKKISNKSDPRELQFLL